MNKKSFYAGAIGFLIGGPLGAIIGFVLGSIIFSDDKKKENNSGDGNEGGENNFKYCILVLLGEVMKADGRLMSCELDRVKATIRRYYKTESEQKSALKQFQISSTITIILRQYAAVSTNVLTTSPNQSLSWSCWRWLTLTTILTPQKSQ